MSEGKPPLTEEERRRLRLIVGDAPDQVVRMNAWLEAHPGTTITFDSGVYTAKQVLDAARDLGVLLDRLEHPEP